MRTGNNIRQRKDGRFEARYQKGRDDNGRIIYGCVYAATYEEAEIKRLKILNNKENVRHVNLLILGAGSLGQEVKDLALGLRVFQKIAFLDDETTKNDVLGPCVDFDKYIDEYPVAIAAIGDSTIRCKWLNDLIQEGFLIPTLIHPTAVVASNATIESGTIISARATIGQASIIGKGCIIDSGAVVDRNSEVPDWTFIKCGAVYSK